MQAILLIAAFQVFSQADMPVPPNAPNAIQVSEWEFDILHLPGDRQLAGLILSESDEEIEFAEIIRRPGKPMFAVLRWIPPADIERMDRLGDQARDLLRRRFEHFRNRLGIELGRMQDVVLETVERQGHRSQEYRGRWFRLYSATDSETTARCIVRIEQIFRAFEQILPPRCRPARPLTIELFGSLDAYRSYLASHDLQISNPAFYMTAKNQIVAASDLTRFSEQIAAIRRQHAQLRAEYEQRDRRFEEDFAAITLEMKRNGFTIQEIRKAKNARRNAWKARYEAMLNRIDEANRRNDAKFSDVAREMFARLYHEAFHAYLQNYVFPAEQFDVPRWLNEGLAMVFEDGQMDADTLRIDAPDPARLKRLQEDLASTSFHLADVLGASDEDFLNSHDASAHERRYLYSWGLVYYLLFERDTPLGNEWLDYVMKSPVDPIPRFESFAGQPLNAFEREWRKKMRALDSAPR